MRIRKFNFKQYGENREPILYSLTLLSNKSED